MTTSNQEADMGYITNVVQRIAEALVMSTEFPKQISDMKADLASLHTDLETTKGRNAELDALLHDTRRQRDEAEQALSQANTTLADAQHQVETLKSYQNTLTIENGNIRDELASVRKESEDFELKAMLAEERAKLAEAKLAKLAEALGLPKTEAKPEPTQSTPTTEPTGTIPHGDPEPTPPKRVYQGEEGFSTLSYTTEKWDSDKLEWYRIDDMPF